jgi:hypothetical protein
MHLISWTPRCGSEQLLYQAKKVNIKQVSAHPNHMCSHVYTLYMLMLQSYVTEVCILIVLELGTGAR